MEAQTLTSEASFAESKEISKDNCVTDQSDNMDKSDPSKSDENSKCVSDSETKDTERKSSVSVSATKSSDEKTSDDLGVKIKTVSYSRTVEYKDGKLIETKKGVKRVDNNWFLLDDKGSWVPTSKEKALESSNITKALEDKSSISTKTEESKTISKKEDCKVCKHCGEKQSSDTSLDASIASLMLMSRLFQPVRPRFSIFDLMIL